MALDVTLDQVKCVIDLTDTVTDDCWLEMLDDAITKINSTTIEHDCGTDVANMVAKYLAAHIMSQRDPQQISRGTLDTNESFTDKYGIGYDITRYGQLAMRFDCTNTLSNEHQKAQEITPTLRFTAIGP